MNIVQMEKIDFWDLRKEDRGTVYVVDNVTLDRGRPDKFVIAACLVPSPIDRVGAMKSVTVHGNPGAWALATEYETAQKATSYQYGTLAEVLERFAEAAGVEALPPIKFIEPGVGVYDGTKRYISENPWAMKDGEVYEFTRSNGQRQQWMADIRDGFTRVIHIDQAEPTYESFDPRVLFKADEWKTMRIAPEPSEAEVSARVARRSQFKPR